MATSRDDWEIPLLRYSWLNPGSLASLFAVDPTTAMVTMTPTASNLDYNIRNQYSLVLRVVDGNGLVDTANVTINIIDVNDAAVLTGVADASNNTIPQGTSLLLSENVNVGHIVGYVRAFDEDVGPWGQKIFGLVSTPDARFFAVNASTGAIYVSAPGLNYWDQTRFFLNVSNMTQIHFTLFGCTSGSGLNLTQVNTVRVSQFAVSPNTPVVQGQNITGIGYPGVPSDVDALITTRGLASVLILGQGFGWTARYLSLLALSASVTTVSATYGPTGKEFVAQNCFVSTPNTVITCSVPAGTGTSFIWIVTINNAWTASSTTKLGFYPPNVWNVTLANLPLSHAPDS